MRKVILISTLTYCLLFGFNDNTERFIINSAIKMLPVNLSNFYYKNKESTFRFSNVAKEKLSTHFFIDKLPEGYKDKIAVDVELFKTEFTKEQVDNIGVLPYDMIRVVENLSAAYINNEYLDIIKYTGYLARCVINSNNPQNLNSTLNKKTRGVDFNKLLPDNQLLRQFEKQVYYFAPIKVRYNTNVFNMIFDYMFSAESKTKLYMKAIKNSIDRDAVPVEYLPAVYYGITQNEMKIQIVHSVEELATLIYTAWIIGEKQILPPADFSPMLSFYKPIRYIYRYFWYKGKFRSYYRTSRKYHNSEFNGIVSDVNNELIKFFKENDINISNVTWTMNGRRFITGWKRRLSRINLYVKVFDKELRPLYKQIKEIEKKLRDEKELNFDIKLSNY